MPLTIRAHGRSDRGLVRQGNEDTLHIDTAAHVYAVCDGMGGHQAGEVASLTASETLQSAFHELSMPIRSSQAVHVGRTLPDNASQLVKAVRLANQLIKRKSQTDTGKSGMGTTIVAATFDLDLLTVVHVGDSRAYRLGASRLEPLTRDHSWVAELQAQQNISQSEAEQLIGKNVISRALGVRETVDIDVRLVRVRPGDVVILCSDGLCGFADDEEIFSAANRHRQKPSEIVDALIALAHDRGAPDNVTVIVLEVLGVNDSDLPEVEVFTSSQNDPPPETQKLLDELESITSSRETSTEEISPAKPPAPKGLILLFVAFAIAAAAIYFLMK